MKHFILFTFLVAFLSPCMAQHQKQWQLRLGGGYDFSTASHHILNNPVGSRASGVSVKTLSSSFGRGLSVNADITYWINHYFGFTASATWHRTLPAIKGNSSEYLSGAGSEEDNTWRSNTVMATAGITLKIPDTKLNPYIRMGMLLPVYSRITSDDDWKYYVVRSTPTPPGTGTSQKVYKLRNTVGYNAAVGITPALSKHTALFAEISLQSLAMLARHATITTYKQGGIEKVNTLGVSGRETDYLKEIDDSYFNGYLYNSNIPSRQLTFSFPFNSIGIHIGISFKL